MWWMWCDVMDVMDVMWCDVMDVMWCDGCDVMGCDGCGVMSCDVMGWMWCNVMDVMYWMGCDVMGKDHPLSLWGDGKQLQAWCAEWLIVIPSSWLKILPKFKFKFKFSLSLQLRPLGWRQIAPGLMCWGSSSSSAPSWLLSSSSLSSLSLSLSLSPSLYLSLTLSLSHTPGVVGRRWIVPSGGLHPRGFDSVLDLTVHITVQFLLSFPSLLFGPPGASNSKNKVWHRCSKAHCAHWATPLCLPPLFASASVCKGGRKQSAQYRLGSQWSSSASVETQKFSPNTNTNTDSDVCETWVGEFGFVISIHIVA